MDFFPQLFSLHGGFQGILEVEQLLPLLCPEGGCQLHFATGVAP
jgi:hypothetical protein